MGTEIPKGVEGLPTPAPIVSTQIPSQVKPGKIKDIANIVTNVTGQLKETAALQDEISKAMYQKMHSPEKAQTPEQLKSNLDKASSQLEKAHMQLAQARAKIGSLADYKLERGKSALEDVQKLEMQVKVLEKTRNSLQNLVNSPQFNEALKTQRNFFQDSIATQDSSKKGKDKASDIHSKCMTCIDSLEKLKSATQDDKVKEKITKMQHDVLDYAKSCLTSSKKQVDSDYKLPFFSFKGALQRYTQNQKTKNANKSIDAQMIAIDQKKGTLAVVSTAKVQKSVDMLSSKPNEANARAFFLKTKESHEERAGVEFHGARLSNSIVHRNLTAQSHEIEAIGTKILQVESELQKHLNELESPKPISKQRESEIADINNAILYLESQLETQKAKLQERSSSTMKAELYGFIAQLEQKIDQLKVKLQVVEETSTEAYTRYFNAEKKFLDELSNISKPGAHNQGSSLYKAYTEFKEEAQRGKGLENLNASRTETLDRLLSTQCKELLSLSEDEDRLQKDILSGNKEIEPGNPVQYNMLLSIAEKGMAAQLLSSSTEIDVNLARFINLLEAHRHRFPFPTNKEFQTLRDDYKITVTHLSSDLKQSKDLSLTLKLLRESSKENAPSLLFEAHERLERIKDPSVKSQMQKEVEETQAHQFEINLDYKSQKGLMKTLEGLAKKQIGKEKIEQESEKITTALTTLMSHAVYSTDKKTKEEASSEVHALFQKLDSEINLTDLQAKVNEKIQRRAPELFQKFAENKSFEIANQNPQNQSLLVSIQNDFKMLKDPQNKEVKDLAFRLNENQQKLMKLLKDQVPYASKEITGAFLGIPTQDQIVIAAKDRGIELKTQVPVLDRNSIRLETRNRQATIISTLEGIKKGDNLLSAIRFHEAAEERDRLIGLQKQNPGDATLQTVIMDTEKELRDIRANRKLDPTSFNSAKMLLFLEKAKLPPVRSATARKELQSNLSKHLCVVLHNDDPKKIATSKAEISKFLQVMSGFPHDVRDEILYSDATIVRMLHTATREGKIDSAQVSEDLMKIYDLQAILFNEIEKILSSPSSKSPEELSDAFFAIKEKISTEKIGPYIFSKPKSDKEKAIQLISYLIYFAGKNRISMTEEKDTIQGLFKDLALAGYPNIGQFRKVFDLYNLRPNAKIDETGVTKTLFNVVSDLTNRSLPAVQEFGAISENLPITSPLKTTLTSDLERLGKETEALMHAIGRSTGNENLVDLIESKNKQIATHQENIVKLKLAISEETNRIKASHPDVIDLVKQQELINNDEKVIPLNAQIAKENAAIDELRRDLFQVFQGKQATVIPALAEYGTKYAQTLFSVMQHFKAIDEEIAQKGEKITPQEREAIGKYQQVKSKFNQILTGSTKLQIVELLNNTQDEGLRKQLIEAFETFENASRALIT